MQGQIHGTRSQTLIVIDRRGNVQWHERTRPAKGGSAQTWDRDDFSFTVGGARGDAAHAAPPAAIRRDDL